MPIKQTVPEELLRSVPVLSAGLRKTELGLDLLTGKGENWSGIFNTTEQCPKTGAGRCGGCIEERVLLLQGSKAKCHCKGYT